MTHNNNTIDDEFKLLVYANWERASMIAQCELSELECAALSDAAIGPRQQVAVWETASSIRRDYGVDPFKKGGRHQ